MELICEACRATIQIPDERVPQNSTFRLTCPRCKRKIVASTKAAESTGASTTCVSLTDSSSEVMLAANDSPDEGLSGVMDSLQPGQSAVLLCVNREECRRDLKAMLEGMDYAVDMPAAADQALQQLRFNQYSVILLDDDFEGGSPKRVMAYLASLNMSHRREMFVVLIGERFKTADHLQAFVDSVDLVLHPHDISQLTMLLNRGLRDHERFYKVFNECLIEAGKKL
jgi:CheY-like chemotaxis protein